MNIVHISKEDQENVFAMVSAVLWLGDVSFTVIDNENHVEIIVDEGKLRCLCRELGNTTHPKEGGGDLYYILPYGLEYK